MAFDLAERHHAVLRHIKDKREQLAIEYGEASGIKGYFSHVGDLYREGYLTCIGQIKRDNGDYDILVVSKRGEEEIKSHRLH